MKQLARNLQPALKVAIDAGGWSPARFRSQNASTVSGALEVRGLSKKFGDFHALSDVTFDLKKGEFLTMLGPSGSGKSTTLKIIAGFLAPDVGDVSVEGRSVVSTPPDKRNIGMVFQDYALFPHMTIAKNVGFPLECRRIPSAQRKRLVERMLEVVGLESMADRFPRQLSGGQQQRVALARALVFEPELVLLDEPMGALDKKLRQTMQFEIMRIVREVGATVISVTHDQEEAMVMSDRIALFNRGRIEQIGTPSELYEQPCSQFVADFIGESNLFSATVLPGAQSVRLSQWDSGTGHMAVDLPPAAREGDEVTVLVRPDRIHPLSVERARLTPSSPDQGEVSGVVKERVYLGTEFRMLVEVAGGPIVKVADKNVRDFESFEIGKTACLRWSKEDAVIIGAR
jgi:putative spermidine/putrescine transport system ATP-binding protein